MNEDRFFKVNWGMLRDRLDPLPFQSSFFLRRLLDHGCHEFVRFSSIAGGFGNGFPLGREEQADETTNVVQLRPTNMDAEGRWLFEKVTFVEDSAVPPSAKEIAPGEIVFNNTNSQQLVGKSAVWDASFGERVLLSNHMTQIVMNSGYDAEVYAYILNIYRRNRVFYNLATNWNNQSGFAGDRLRSLPMPKLSASDQLQLAERIGDSREQSRKKLAEADALLASVDDYLLSELSIVLPPEPENTIGNRMFRTKASDLGGWRFDPLFHSFTLWHAIEASPTPSAHLGRYCRLAKTGFAAGGNMQLHNDDGIIQIRPTNIGSDRQLKFDRNVYLDRSILAERPTDVLQRKEVLFNNTNSQEQVGKTAYFDIDGSFVCSNHITRIATNEAKLLPEYLTAVLNTYQRLKVFYSICTNWNNQSGVNVDLLRKLTIPIPSIEKQRDIAREVSATFDQANILRQGAADELDQAKADIEAIMLGDAA